jgi:hypothetical protein
MGLVAFTGGAGAQEPADPELAGAPSERGIEPVPYLDNPTCAHFAPAGKTWYELRVEDPSETTDPEYFNGEFTDGYLTVDISEYFIDDGDEGEIDGQVFEWTSNMDIEAIFVKGGNYGNFCDYQAFDFKWDDLLHAPINTGSGDYYGLSHISFCYEYQLDVTKDASTSFTRTHYWDITKDADATYDLFTGDTRDHEYVVSVDKTDHTDSDWAVKGTITIENNTPVAATIADATDEISDYGLVAVDCGVTFPYALAAGGTLECSYSAAAAPDDTTNPFGDINTATVTTSGAVGGSTATADVDFTQATITEVNDEVTVTDTNAAFGGSKTVSDDDGWTYEIEFACDGDEGDHTNTTEVIGDDDVVLDSDTATVTINCHELTVTKDSTVSEYSQEYEWDITKSPDGDYDLFRGDKVVHLYTIDVSRGDLAAESALVSGNITVSNEGNPIDAAITDVADVVSGTGLDDVTASVDCSVTFPHTIAAGEELECTYSATVDSADYDVNTTAATLQNYDYTSDGTPTKDGTTDFSGQADVVFTGVTPTVMPVYIVDDYATVGHETDDLSWGPFMTSESVTYQRTFACDADEGSYQNTATLVDGEDNPLLDDEDNPIEDTATVMVDCYALTVTKDAQGTYDERHTWDIEKSVDPTSQSGYPGDELSWMWTVDLSESSADENFSLTDDITISNEGNPIAAEITNVADVVSGAGLTDVEATVDCGVDFPHTIAAGGTLACTYDAGTADLRDYDLNTATATLQNYRYYFGFDPAQDAETIGTTDFSGTAEVNYTAKVINGTVTVTDDEIGLNEPVTAGEGPWQWIGSDSHTCSSSRADYFQGGVYTPISETLDNTAKVKDGDTLLDEDDATTTWTCEASFVDILKTFNGSVDPTKDVWFRLYDSEGTYLGDEVSTFGDADGQLQFQTALVPAYGNGTAVLPGDSYTICEAPVPAGYNVEVTDESEDPLETYAGPPGAPDSTGEIQCFDFTAAQAGTTLLFQVNNSYAGGAPRTPGYWKNWSTCSGGNQAETAEKLGGVDEGVYLLDDLLPQTIGDFSVGTCEDGILVLDARSLKNLKKAANDAAYQLARNLLAARLNQGAGACDPVGWTWEHDDWAEPKTFEQVLTEADQLLAGLEDGEGFDGTGDYLAPKNKDQKDLRAYALFLAGIIDDYNNSEFCTGEPSH